MNAILTSVKRRIAIGTLTAAFLTGCLLMQSCKSEIQIPAHCEQAPDVLAIYPDYTDVIVPPNIAPLNFMVKNKGEEFLAEIKSEKSSLLAAAQKDSKIEWDSVAWRQLLKENKGKELQVTLYALNNEKWIKYPSYALRVATEEIDPYLSYRLIEPGYEQYRQLGIYQRNLTNFTEQVVYENNRSFDDDENHCINCHNYQSYDANNMLFHVRGGQGGTVLVQNGKVQKVNIKSDSILSGAVYPAWHPKQPLIAFSSNKTGQTFHVNNPEKIEVIDEASDLILYDAEKNTVKNILKGVGALETFPCWNPAGTRLYYCVAETPEQLNLPDSLRTVQLVSKYDSLHYNIMSMAFDEKTRTFGPPELEVNCDAVSKSAAVPRISPDGRFLLFTLGHHGQFHIWHKTADLWVKDLKTGEVRGLEKTNSPEADSYHNWSSNGRWIVFSSRREDGNYTRSYIAYFDKTGKGHKAFLLPQEDPEYNLLQLKSYNVPEFTRNAVKVSKDDFWQVIYKKEARSATFVP